MDHVIKSMQQWLDVYQQDTENRDEKAIRCIKAAIAELEKYYPSREAEFKGFHDITKEK